VRAAFGLLRRAGLAAAVLLWLASGAQADERILAFHSDITVHRDGTLEVRETIRVRAEGRNIRRGIYRDFPTLYPRDGGGQVVVGFSFQSASRDGDVEPWRVENRQNGKRIYLGSAARTLPPGEHTYELVYRTDRQMGFFADHDELYWNVTGNGWGFAIDSASATIRLPDEIPRESIRLEAYTGAQGAKGRDYLAEMRDGRPYYLTTRPLPPEHGLTIVASWPKGYIQAAVENALPPQGPAASPGYDFSRDSGQVEEFHADSPAENFLKRTLPRSNTPFWLALGGFLGLLGYYYLIWDKVGRDPPGKMIIPEYQPPADQSPASMRYILRMGYDNECFAAAVLSLAVKGHLRIQQDAGVLGIGKTFTLIRQTPGAGAQPPTADEQVLLNELFSSGQSLELEEKNHRIVRRARRLHDQSLEKRYSNGFFHINGGWHFLGIVISLVVLLALTLPGNLDPWPRWYLTQPLGWLAASLAIAGIILNGIFGKLLKAPTPKGRAAMDHIRGFRMYMEVAEGESLRKVTAPPPPLTPRLYEAYLPAALALDVEQKWAERFASVLDIQAPNYQPAWYSGPGFDAARLGAFSSQLGKSLNNAISSSSQAPGSKSGSGGGGSSGGGGGGGGGGGW
jgi:uncharacterized membrane protein YgcG